MSAWPSSAGFHSLWSSGFYRRSSAITAFSVQRPSGQSLGDGNWDVLETNDWCHPIIHRINQENFRHGRPVKLKQIWSCENSITALMNTIKSNNSKTKAKIFICLFSSLLARGEPVLAGCFVFGSTESDIHRQPAEFSEIPFFFFFGSAKVQ